MPTTKKLSLIFLFAILLLSIGATFVIARELEVPLPIGNPPITTTKTILSDYLRTIFVFAISISGLIVFGVIVFSGVQVITQAQNPAALGEAKNRILEALIGLVVLLGSYLLLTTLNPRLVIINPQLKGTTEGVLISNPKGEQTIFKTSQSDITDFLNVKLAQGATPKPIQYGFISPAADLDVYVYTDKNFKGAETKLNPIVSPAAADLPSGTKSVLLAYKKPGIYLCKTQPVADDLKGCYYTSVSISSLDKTGFEDEVRYIVIKNPTSAFQINSQEDCTKCYLLGQVYDKSNAPTSSCAPNLGQYCSYYSQKYGVILHEGRNYDNTCKEYLQNGSIPQTTTNGVFPGGPRSNSPYGISSVTVFLQPLLDEQEDPNSLITLYEKPDFGEEGGIATLYPPEQGYNFPDFIQINFINKPKTSINDKISSFKIKGSFLVLLFKDPNYQGTCGVFRDDVSNLSTKNVGGDTVSSAKIIRLKK